LVFYAQVIDVSLLIKDTRGMAASADEDGEETLLPEEGEDENDPFWQ
jgi:hypothetical protein